MPLIYRHNAKELPRPPKPLPPPTFEPGDEQDWITPLSPSEYLAWRRQCVKLAKIVRGDGCTGQPLNSCATDQSSVASPAIQEFNVIRHNLDECS